MQKLLYRTLALSYGAYFNTTALFSAKEAGKQAFKTFTTPRKGRILPVQQEYLQEYLGKRVRVNNIELQTYEWPGTGETVLLMHGWESNAFRWRYLIEKLREREFNIIAFDAPGHGYSEGNRLNVVTYADSARQLINLFRPTHIVGHSMGGLATLHNQHRNLGSSGRTLRVNGALPKPGQVQQKGT